MPHHSDRSPSRLLFVVLGLMVGTVTDTHHAVADVGPIPQWIWGSPLSIDDDQVTLQHDFDVGPHLKAATFDGLADDEMVVTVNGRDVIKSASSREWTKADVFRVLKAGGNQIVIRARNESGSSGVCCRLMLEYENGRRRTIVTDPTWRVWPRDVAPTSSNMAYAVSRGLLGIQPWGDPPGEEGDYYQWKKSLGANQAEATGTMRVLPGFEVELVRSAQPGESSWISVTFDAQGDAIIGCEGRDKRNGLLRLKLPNEQRSAAEVSSAEDTLLEARGLAFKGSTLFANANNAHSLVRLDDRNRDGRFEEVAVLKKSPGSVGHGRNNLCFGPDGKLYSIHGNDVRLPEDFSPEQSRVRNMAVDRLLNCRWDRYLFDWQAKLPAGHLIRTDESAQNWELWATGFRNPYGIDFNTDGELFTFDADNEGDLGTSWYRPTRINHVIPGGDYGWRQGTGMRNEWYPDSLPSNLNIGKSSPTDIKFGTRSNFPARYQRSLFILDWTYGRIYSIEMLPRGASYVGTAELFLEGRPLNVTDLEFGPDGALYFTTGGRATQSGLYRVRFTRSEKDVEPPTAVGPDILIAASTARDIRHRLEAGYGQRDVVELALAHLGDPDAWLRHASRIALESIPAEMWREAVLTPATQPLAAVTGLLTLSRQPGEASKVLTRLNELPISKLSHEELLIAARAYQLCLIRDAATPAEMKHLIRERIESIYPTRCAETNQLACELLIYLESPLVVPRTMVLLRAAKLQEEKFQWLFQLRNVRGGWTIDNRKAYLEELAASSNFDGGRELPIALFSIGSEFRTTLTPAEVAELADHLQPKSPSGQPQSLIPQGTLVKEWKLDDLAGRLNEVGTGRNFKRGEEVFRAANCVKCHRFARQGQPVGPDLSFVGFRFGRRDLLETILLPSKVIDSKFLDITFELKSGRTVTGRVVGGDDRVVLVSPNAASPLETVELERADIESERVSPLSPMPAGLLNTLDSNAILDLLAYLEANGVSASPHFEPGKQ